MLGFKKSQPPFTHNKPQQDPEQLLRKLEEKETLAAERRAAELAAKQEQLRAAEEHAKAVKERRTQQRLGNADEVGMEGESGAIRKSPSRKIDADPIAEEDEE